LICRFFRSFHLPIRKKYGYWLARPLPERIMLPDNIIPFESPKAEHRYPSLPMKSELVYKAAEIIDDPQVLINLVSKRVRQLNSGRAPLIPTVPSMGAADIALTEIIEGKIKLLEVVPEQA
jgi:DNA-directed RNA polymerase subunit omega